MTQKFFAAITLIVLLSISTFSQTDYKSDSKTKSAPKETITPALSQGKITYATIFPMLKEKCRKCHGAETEGKGDLMLLTYKELMKGGEHGKVVVPGKPGKSNLYLKLTDTPPFGKRMPKKANPLTKDELELIKKWIAQGANE